MNLYEGIKNSLKESKYDDNYRGDDFWDLSDGYVNGNLTDNELADYLLNMYERPAAVKAFKEITDGKEFPKMEVPSSDIKEVSEEELHDFIMNWENDRTSVDKGRYIGKEGNKWVVIDNRTGDCWTEEFTNRGSALDYLNDKINADGSPYNESEDIEIRVYDNDDDNYSVKEVVHKEDLNDDFWEGLVDKYENFHHAEAIGKDSGESYGYTNGVDENGDFKEAEGKDLKYGVEGSPEPYIKAVADDMGVDLDSKVPFEYFYAPDSDDEENEEYWYDSDYDYATFYDRILHDMGYGENPILNDCRAEVHEVSDGSYEMSLFYNGKEYTLDIDANDHMEQVKANVDAIIEMLGRQAVKEAEKLKESESGAEKATFLDMDLANYMLDNDIIIGAEYDHPEEYDDEHWLSLLGEALDLAKKENNADMMSKINIAMDKINGAKLNEAEEEFKPNGVVDDIKKRGDGDLDVTSPLELNTGILPIINVDQYSREEVFWDEESLMNDVNGDGSKILEPGDEGYYEITTEMIDDATMRYAPPVIEEYINSVLPGSSVKATKMYHPKYYNYGGDELEFTVTFDPAKYNELEEKTVADPEFKNYLKEHYSSYSGFISYLADNLDEFYQQDGWKRFVQVIMFNLRNEEDEMRNDEDRVWEDILGNI